MARFTNTQRKRTARFPRPGVSFTGRVVEIEDVAVPEFDNGRIVGPKFDMDGTMVMQADVTIEDNSGSLVLIHTRGGIEVAIAQAVKAAKKSDLRVGDTLTVAYVEDEEEPEDSDSNYPTKVYAAEVK